MDFDYDGMNEGSRRKVVAAFRQLIEVDNHKALVSVKSLDQHRVVKEVVAQRSSLLMLEKERVRMPSWTQRGSTNTCGTLLWSDQTGVCCVQRCMMQLSRRIG